MKRMALLRIVVACLFGAGLALVAAPARALDAVTLQLKWMHAFQFAGYYAAKHKGYYREAGLEVRIDEALPGIDPVKIVLDGKAEFGVGTSALLLQRNAGKPVVTLAVIFQHSPYVLIARQQHAAQTIHDLVGKRVMLEPQADELLAYLKAEGIPLERITQVEHSYDTQDLIDGKVDALAAYVINQPYYLDRAKVPYQIYTPRSAGIDFYGDNLFTTEQQLRDYPERVKAFRAASLRGWQYAMEHQEEIIDLILAEYSQRNRRDYHLFEVKQMIPLIRPELIEIGYMYPGRWRHMADTYADIGMLPRGFSLDGFLYDPNPELDLAWLYRSLAGVLLLLGVVGTVAAYVQRNNRRLARILQEGERAESALREELARRKAAERELRTAHERLAMADRMESVGRLAAGVAHEVRNPLSIIRLGVDYMSRRHATDGDEMAILDDIRAAAERADHIIQDLLDFSRPKLLTLSEVDTNYLIDETMNLVKHEFALRNIAVVRDYEASMPPLRADTDRLTQVFINLFTNAAQAIGRDGSIEIITRKRILGESDLARDSMSSFRSGDPAIMVEIRDTGSGVVAEFQKRLFEPFFTTKPMGEGTGLGLAVSRNIVSMHGGSISIFNRPEGGASVCLMFRTNIESECGD
ncbi:MAG: ABC transporter substrate-binding protein [Sulfurisoma sp.]|nr:ABC transporter substrate-binding protein [Sulfurisoma sp.]